MVKLQSVQSSRQSDLHISRRFGSQKYQNDECFHDEHQSWIATAGEETAEADSEDFVREVVFL